MENTMELLAKALEVKRAARWCEELNLDMSTISTAKKRNRLSPALAGNFAIELGESPEKWIAIAAMEAERKSPLTERLRASLHDVWRKRRDSSQTAHANPSVSATNTNERQA